MNYFDYFLFIFSVIIMIATPGPVMILVASAGLKGGYKKALETIFGTNLASLVLIFISVLVLKGVLGINENCSNISRVLGGIYIGYFGFSIINEVIQDPHPQAIKSFAAKNRGFKIGFL
ncbi:LysE family transporter, partial [Acinetobacter baumannii]|uniref:LysE family translocator n=1 Tax=Acinetobacter baumannii TaxID=470 RepID=UPI001C43C8D2